MAEVRLAHRRAGTGEPLVAVHGIGSTWQVWSPILPRLEARHDVLALSMPGYGESAPLDREPTVPALVDAVEEAMDALGFDTAHIIGNSLGGWVAAELAVRGRARTVVAFAPAGLWTRRELAYSTRLLRVSRAGAERLAPHADRITATAVGRRLALGHVYARPERVDAREAAFAIRMLAGSPSFHATLDWIERGYEMPRGLERIECPFRAIWGTVDLVLPRRQGPRWERIVPDAELVQLPGLGHVPMGDDPQLTAAKVLEVTAAGAREPEPARS